MTRNYIAWCRYYLLYATFLGKSAIYSPGFWKPSRRSRTRSPRQKGRILPATFGRVQRWRRRRLSSKTRGLLDRHISEALCLAAQDLGCDAAFAGREARTGFY